MKPQQTLPLLTAIAPAALAVPPIALIAALGVGLIWLLSRDDKPEPKPAGAGVPQPQPHPQPKPQPVNFAEPKPTAPPASVRSSHVPSAVSKRITREDLAEALAYGERQFTRKEAVAALEALGFRKTAAYKALNSNGKFGAFIKFTPDGLVEWLG
jgi:hypothetical protein